MSDNHLPVKRKAPTNQEPSLKKKKLEAQLEKHLEQSDIDSDNPHTTENHTGNLNVEDFLVDFHKETSQSTKEGPNKQTEIYSEDQEEQSPSPSDRDDQDYEVESDEQIDKESDFLGESSDSS